MRAGVREATQRVVVPAALQEQRPAEQRDRDAGAARRGLLVERARIVTAIRNELPARLEHRVELALEEVVVDERARGKRLRAPDIIVDVALLGRQRHGARSIARFGLTAAR